MHYKPDLANSPWKSPSLFLLLELDDLAFLELLEYSASACRNPIEPGIL